MEVVKAKEWKGMMTRGRSGFGGGEGEGLEKVSLYRVFKNPRLNGRRSRLKAMIG